MAIGYIYQACDPLYVGVPSPKWRYVQYVCARPQGSVGRPARLTGKLAPLVAAPSTHMPRNVSYAPSD